jgi:hypothetical protein
MDGVFEVDELGAEGVFVAGGGAYVGLAEGTADDLRSAAVVWKGDCGFVFGGSSSRHGWSLVGVVVLVTEGRGAGEGGGNSYA